MSNDKKIALVWLRRDLRLHDHAALSHGAQDAHVLHLCFCFDTQILRSLPDKKDRRITFIIQSLQDIEEKLNKKGGSLHILFGDPTQEIVKLCKRLNVTDLYFNRDYESYAQQRDQKIQKQLTCRVHHFKDHVFFEADEVLKRDGTPYKVFTPFKNLWLERFREFEIVPQYKCSFKNLFQWNNPKSIVEHDWYQTIGFKPVDILLSGGSTVAKGYYKKFQSKIDRYQEDRDFPILDGTSSLSPYIRHGCLSVRDMIRLAVSSPSQGAQIWLSEIIWREFYQMLLQKFPHIERQAFKPEYDKIKWKGKDEYFEAWKNGQTGFPLIDAAMRHFKNTGLIHNRLRMVVASFLCKTLLVDWRKGEEYFAQILLDFDLAANNGGWQWCSSSGCDAQPYFRIFNPYSQSQKFDKDGDFIKKHCPELKDFPAKFIHQPHLADMLIQAESNCTIGVDYPFPIVDYKENRERAIIMYQKAVKNL